jgi:archaeal type IV pilus assembly protein PilA
MMQMQKRDDHAVSPVVGVMLMLVVTIIIAAIVAAFAGGLGSGSSKTPQATIQGTYSLTNGMTITHSGGDPIPLGTTTIFVRPTKSFGPDADKYSWQINKTVIYTNQTQNWATARAFLPGDTATISANNLTWVQTHTDTSGVIVSDSQNPTYGFDLPSNVGLSFVLEFQDASGRSIGQGTVIITG